MVGVFSIVDDYSYFSTKVKIGRCCHIAPNCTIAGGKDHQFTLGDFSSIASGTRIYCQSNKYSHELIAIIPEEAGIDSSSIKGDIHIGPMFGVGANSVIMPDNNIPEGVAIGALSFVPPQFKFQPWSVYAGNPIQYIRPRNKDHILTQVSLIQEKLGLSKND
jgi:acetyltransferase-like isoleucine patch superfamily enzyme